MSISVRCPACEKGHKAPERAAGKTLNCLACGEPILVPAANFDPAAYLLDLEEPSPTPSKEIHAATEHVSPRSLRPRPDLTKLPPLTMDEPPFWRRHLHWLLVLAMIPLAVSLLTTEAQPLGARLLDTLLQSPGAAERLARLGNDANLDDILGTLPDQRLKGAWLPRSTLAHWGLAAGATALFLIFFMFLASDGSARPGHVLAVGLLTATIGVGFLLLVQMIASWTDGYILTGRSVLVLVFYVFKFIAFSYDAASNPENGFVLSLLGYTFGVGLLEELVKALPLFWHREESKGNCWRGLFIWGLASGAGFGIAEGILYSARYYNGISGPGDYVVRFLSCVALHAIWTGSVAITLHLNRSSFDRLSEWHEWIAPILSVIGTPMLLHGLYDTCLKRHMPGVALLVAIASFALLAYLSSRLYGTDDQDANAAMLAEYRRRQKAMS